MRRTFAGDDKELPAETHVPQKPPMLSVVLSFFNEADALPELIQRLRRVLGHATSEGLVSGYELIFVNDASTDESLSLLLEHARGRDDIRVVNMSRNFGVTPCVLAGMEHASGHAVVYMDADLQDPPEVIPALIQAWQREQVDVVHTVRRSRAGESRVKLLLTRIAYHVLRYISNIDIRIEAGDFKLLARRAVDELIRFREKKPFMRGLVSWIGFRQTVVHYDRAPRGAGKTKFPIYSPKVIRNFLESALISFSDVPLRLSIFFGFMTSVIAALLLLHVLVEKMRGHNIPGWTALMVTMLFIGSIQMFLVGIQSLYVNSIYLEVKWRPNYIVESRYGFPESLGLYPHGDRADASPPDRMLG